MFDQIYFDLDAVTFVYSDGGKYEQTSIKRPKRISYSQWSSFWEDVKKLNDSGESIEDIVQQAIDDED